MENITVLLNMIVPVDWLWSAMPVGASNHADALDGLYWFLIVTCGILFLLVIVPLGFVMYYFRRKTPGQRAKSQKDHNFWLESLWTFVPLIYLAVLFVWGFWQYMDMYVAPHNAKELRVIGQKWQWSVDYPEEGFGVAGVGSEIAVPLGQPIKLVMSSQDVIHSFFIPNMRVKQDVVPGRYSTLWFTPTKVGTFPILCAEYCGDLHSQMLMQVKVVPQASFANWVEEKKAADTGLPLAELGEKLYKEKLGCIACHTTDGTIRIGPSFKDLYGKMEKLTNGTTQKVDDNYIREKILNPNKTNVVGFAPVMPSFQGRVGEREITGLIAFIKKVSGVKSEEEPKAPSPPPAAAPSM